MTGPRFLVLFGALGGAVLLTLLWVAILRRRVEEKTETLRAVLESTEEGILAVDSEGRVAGYNHKCLRDVGKSPKPSRTPPPMKISLNTWPGS